MDYVLILFFFFGDGAVTSVNLGTFDTEEACAESRTMAIKANPTMIQELLARECKDKDFCSYGPVQIWSTDLQDVRGKCTPILERGEQ